MARVTLPGGVVASCVWDYAGEMTLLRAFWDATHEVEPAAAADADEGAVMPWCAEDELGQLFRAAGVGDVRSGALRRARELRQLRGPLVAASASARSRSSCRPAPGWRRGSRADGWPTRSRLR